MYGVYKSLSWMKYDIINDLITSNKSNMYQLARQNKQNAKNSITLPIIFIKDIKIFGDVTNKEMSCRICILVSQSNYVMVILRVTNFSYVQK